MLLIYSLSAGKHFIIVLFFKWGQATVKGAMSGAEPEFPSVWGVVLHLGSNVL